jgi:hypothetical protein
MTGRTRLSAVILVMGIVCGAPVSLAGAQTLSSADRDAIVRQHVARGGSRAGIDSALAQVDAAAGKNLPTAPLVNKIREGISKNVDAARIEAVVRQIATHLETADGLIRDLASGPPAASVERANALALLAEALGGGVTADEVRALGRVPPGGATMSGLLLASAARSLSFVSAARLPVAEGAAVVNEALRRGFRPNELVDLGREIKRHERDYQTGRASLRTLREAIARGDRPEQLFPDVPAAVERPAPARPETPTVREPVTRPTPAERPTVPERPTRPDRPTTPERPGTPR